MSSEDRKVQRMFRGGKSSEEKKVQRIEIDAFGKRIQRMEISKILNLEPLYYVEEKFTF